MCVCIIEPVHKFIHQQFVFPWLLLIFFSYIFTLAQPYNEERDLKRRRKEKEAQIEKVEEAAKRLKNSKNIYIDISTCPCIIDVHVCTCTVTGMMLNLGN